jgi:hypothetical protein
MNWPEKEVSNTGVQLTSDKVSDEDKCVSLETGLLLLRNNYGVNEFVKWKTKQQYLF